MKSVKTAIALLACCGMSNAALANEACLARSDAMALKTAAVQQELMVAAFMCADKEAYNSFVLAYQGDLQDSDAMLKAYFLRTGGRHGEADYDTYKTRAANLSGLAQARTGGAFCALTGELFDMALRNHGSLAQFVAAAPPAPGFAPACVDDGLETAGGGRPVRQALAGQ